MALRRLGPELFGATMRPGELWTGDQVLLETLPQGQARLATLQVTEMMKVRSEIQAAATENAGGEPMEPPAKKPRTPQGAADDGAAEHVGRRADAKGTEQQDPDGMTNAETDTPELFRHGTAADRPSVEWL